jgi:TolA protein
MLTVFSGRPAHSDDTSVGQTISQPINISDTSTAILISSDTIQSKIDSATSSLQTTAQIDQNAIISLIQTNVPNSDTSTAVQIAITQEPISTSIESATAKVQIAQQAIQSAIIALNVLQNQQSLVDSQTVIVSNFQSKVDGATAVVEDKTNVLQIAQSTLDSNPLVVVSTTAPGIVATVYRAQNGASPSLENLGTPITTVIVPSIAYQWGSGPILNSGMSDHVIVVFKGQITVPNTTDIYYAVYSDDGSKLYINGSLVINNWRDQGLTWSPYSQHFNVTPGQTQDISLYYYENAGGAGVVLGWGYNGIWTSPTSSNYSHVTSTTLATDPVLVQNVISAQNNLANAQQNLTIAEQNLTIEQQKLTIANQNLTIALQTANSLADSATVSTQEAVNSMNNSVQITQNYYAEQAAIKAAAEALAAQQAAEAARQAALQAQAEAQAAAEAAAKALADQQAAEAAKAKAEADALAAQQAADKAEADRIAAEEAKAKAEAEAKAKAEAEAKAEADRLAAEAEAKTQAEAKAKADADKAAAEATAKEQAAKDAQAKSDAEKANADKLAAEKAAADKAKEDAIGVKPNSPDQLSDTVVKEAPKEALIPHIQVDKVGVENGGIEFFGTKSAPQVVGEDGKLTPPAPPPGSGLPIPAEAITTTDTFIGQPGGTTFNAPDIAIPVILAPVEGALAVVPGVQAVNQAYVALANIGNDMSPVTRKKAKKILVLTVAVTAIRRRFGS